MTPTADERAEKIFFIVVKSNRTLLPIDEGDIKAISEQIKQAEQEAYDRGFKDGREQGAHECRHAKDIALEEAARII